MNVRGKPKSKSFPLLSFLNKQSNRRCPAYLSMLLAAALASPRSVKPSCDALTWNPDSEPIEQGVCRSRLL
ncbi:unnamed protein product [Arctogadus glacialis]